MILDGLNDLDVTLFRKFYGTTRKEVKRLITENYALDATKEYYDLQNRDRLVLMDEYLKFIRGTIQWSALFRAGEFESDLLALFRAVVNNLKLSPDELKSVKSNVEAILVCVMCLMQECRFTFDDGESAFCFLALYPVGENFDRAPDSNSLLSICVKDNRTTSVLFVLDAQAGNYVERNDELKEYGYMQAVPWFNARRDGAGKLKLRT